MQSHIYLKGWINDRCTCIIDNWCQRLDRMKIFICTLIHQIGGFKKNEKMCVCILSFLIMISSVDVHYGVKAH